MTPETIDKIKEVFALIAEKIGQGAQFGWDIVVRQQYVAAWEGIFSAIIGIIIGYVVYRVVKKSMVECEKDEYSNWFITGMLVGVFGGITSCLLIIGGIDQAITHFINPAYYALDFFIHLGK